MLFYVVNLNIINLFLVHFFLTTFVYQFFHTYTYDIVKKIKIFLFNDSLNAFIYDIDNIIPRLAIFIYFKNILHIISRPRLLGNIKIKEQTIHMLA